MKLDARQVASFLRSPGQVRLVLLNGEDETLIRERSLALLRQVAGSADDPFLSTELTREGWAKIPAEMTALSLVGGRRVIIVRDAGEGVLPAVVEAMNGPGEALLILEAAGLGRGKLKTYTEARTDAASIGCYAEEGQALTDMIKRSFVSRSVSADNEALLWLADTLGRDRGLIQGELEKLALLAGASGRVSLEMARAHIGNVASASVEEALTAALLGDGVRADAAIETSLQSGLNGVGVVRFALAHLQRLHQTTLRMQTGMPVSDAIKCLRPPVFYKATALMKTCLTLWSSQALLEILEDLRQVELECKQTGGRPEWLVRRYLQGIAMLSKEVPL